MSIVENIYKLEKALKDSKGIQKSAPVSKSDAEGFLDNLADHLREKNPSFSPEQAFAKAAESCPVIGSLACGHSLDMARGHY